LAQYFYVPMLSNISKTVYERYSLMPETIPNICWCWSTSCHNGLKPSTLRLGKLKKWPGAC
jgi:hypothetical protein